MRTRTHSCAATESRTVMARGRPMQHRGRLQRRSMARPGQLPKQPTARWGPMSLLARWRRLERRGRPTIMHRGDQRMR